MSSSSPINPVVDHLADLALWEAELAADRSPRMRWLLTRCRWRRRCWTGCGRCRTRAGCEGLRHPLLVILVLTACATLVVGNDSRDRDPAVGGADPAGCPAPSRGPVQPADRAGTRCPANAPSGGSWPAWTVTPWTRRPADTPPTSCVATRRCRSSPPAATSRSSVSSAAPPARAVTHPAPAGLLPAAAIDGKLLHGTRTEAGQVFLVAAITHDRGVILGQRQVPDKRGENAVIADLLAPLDVAGMMLTLDALHTTKKTARLITGPLGVGVGGLLGEVPAELRRGEQVVAAGRLRIVAGAQGAVPVAQVPGPPAGGHRRAGGLGRRRAAGLVPDRHLRRPGRAAQRPPRAPGRAGRAARRRTPSLLPGRHRAHPDPLLGGGFVDDGLVGGERGDQCVDRELVTALE